MEHSKERFSQFTSHFAILVAVLVLLLMSCARIGSPDGGPFDETPPKILRTSPQYGASKANDTKIVIEFDEIVKIENPQEKVVVSPPQIEQPEIEAVGKKITVTLNDTLVPNMTYTIDFADAIADNNEGNPLGDYAFTFSTGERLDTMQVSGYVLDASNLEPIKGMLVGLYWVGPLSSDSIDEDLTEELPDSVFRTVPFERISRTDGSGHFVVKGLAPGKYRAFALNDQNQNYVYDQPSERIAFSERVFETSCRPDVRQDTIWHDSIYYDSIVSRKYTHFFPDDITLLAFQPEKQSRFLLKSERPTLEHFSIFFTAPSDTLPKLIGLNFDATDAFVVDASAKNDTLDYWIRDSLIYNLDTLDIKIDFYATDTLGELSLTTDTLHLVSKISKEKLEKQKKEKWEEWVKQNKQKMKEDLRAGKKSKKKKRSKDNAEANNADGDAPQDNELADSESEAKNESSDKDNTEIPPMPEEFLEYKTSSSSSIAPDQNIDFTFSEPLDTVDMSKLHFAVKRDSLFVPKEFIFRQVPGKIMTYRLYAEWEPDSTYQFVADTAAFVNIYGKRSEEAKRTIKVKNLDTFSTLFVSLVNADTSAVVQLLDANDKPVKIKKSENGKADFYFMNPGLYYMRMFYDLNGNGIWDTGDYDEHLQPEPMYYYPGALTLKALWEVTQTWNPTELQLFKQKPGKITKQKPDKAKSVRNKNAEREAAKRKKK